MSNVEPELNKVYSPFESLLLGLQGNREVALNIRHKLYEIKGRIKGPETASCGSAGEKLKDVCPQGALPELLFVKDDENNILREIEDLCTELLELF